MHQNQDSISQIEKLIWLSNSQESLLLSEVMNTYLGARDLAYSANAMHVAEEIQIDPGQINFWRDQQKRWSAFQSALYKLFAASAPKETLKKFDETNASWEKEVGPFFFSPYYNEITYKGKVPSNFIKKIAGNKPHQIVMQNLVKNNPELTRLALGQMYADHPEKMLEFDEDAEQYIQAHPPTKALREKQIEAAKKLQEATRELEAVKKLYPEELAAFEQKQKISEEFNKGKMESEKLEKVQKKYDDLMKKNNFIRKVLAGFVLGVFLLLLRYWIS